MKVKPSKTGYASMQMTRSGVIEDDETSEYG
jgi:hypothetical protein